ncbi:MAG: Crp/Fnr family transcriptional regulator [Alphaproteobacteria bacterium]|nr:MAG: Crp/Fnr family transcriptional regulator [Alphaproteobacteria bacterium]
MQSKRRELLQSNYMFRGLPEDLIDRIVAMSVTRKIGAGETLFYKNDDGDALCGILGGRIRISTSTPGGQELVLNVIEEGEIFGEIALLDGKPRTADAIAIVPTELMIIHRRDVREMLKKEPILSLHFLELAGARLRWLSDRIEDSAFLDVAGRLAKQLLHMAEIHGEHTPEGIVVKLQPSQSELGQMLGTSRISISKHLRRWRDKEWVALRRGVVLLKEPEALETLVADKLEA